MCGIFGLFLSRSLTEADISLGRLGCEALAHRGPDGDGEWFDIDAGVYLGHRRLSILDLSDAASQPMKSNANVLSYNGEVYNFLELRSRLKGLGATFTSTGDTEVLLRGWEHWGSEVLDHIDGMFAFALWDGQHGYLSIDAFGEKQLFYAITSDGIYFSSELLPLAQLLEAERDINEELLTAYLCLGYFPSPATAYKKIKRLDPGTFLTINQGQVKEEKTYWKPSPLEAGRGRVRPLSEQNLDRIRDVLIQSIERRLLADVPLCLFLSSGVDSSLVASLLKCELEKDVTCLTVSFPRGAVVNEAPVARRIAGHLGLEFIEVESSETSSAAGADAVLDFFGQPNSGLTVIPQYQVASSAVSNFSVAIGGMGGDELFCGYFKHWFFYRYRHLYALPESLRLGLGGFAGMMPGSFSRIRHFSNLVGVRSKEFYLANKNYPCIEWLRQLPKYEEWTDSEFMGMEQPELSIPFYELTKIMANCQLPSLDLGSMRASLELRTPFLCRALIDELANHDARAFMAFGQKSVLRRLLGRYLPEELRDQPKMGFVFPADIFLKPYSDKAPDVSGLPRSFVDKAWENRSAQGWSSIAVRLALLSQFTSNNC